MGGKRVAHTSKLPNSLKGFSKALLKVWSGRSVASYCKLLCAGILCSYSCSGRSGYSAAVNLQLYKRKSKGHRLEMGYPVYFGLSCIFQSIGKILLFNVYFIFGHATWLGRSEFPNQELNLGPWQSKCSVLTTGPPGNYLGNILNLKQKQWNTKVKVKEIDLIWSQTCSSLLHVLTD